jgi:hypothetical protein
MNHSDFKLTEQQLININAILLENNKSFAEAGEYLCYDICVKFDFSLYGRFISLRFEGGPEITIEAPEIMKEG